MPQASASVVSVVIVSWNTRELLRGCLASLAPACAQMEGRVETIVVDNGSADGSAGMVRDEFPDVDLVANQTNVGFAAATNQGIRKSSGRYVLLLNPDTAATPSFLSVLVSFLEAHPAAAAAGPRLVDKGGADQASCFPLPTIGREAWRLFHMDRLHKVASYPVGRWGAEEPRAVESIQGACMLIRREALEAVGLLDERFFVYTEEIDLCRRFLGSGWEIYWVPRARVAHYGGASTAQVSRPMFLQLYRSKVIYFRKHQGATGAIAYKAVLAAASLPRVLLPAMGMLLMPSRRESLRTIAGNYSTLLIQLPVL